MKTRKWTRSGITLLAAGSEALILRHRWFVIALGCIWGLLIVLAGPLAFGQTGVRITGQMECRYPSVGSSTLFLFELFWDEKRWLVRLFEHGASNMWGHSEFGFDETNQYTLRFLNKLPWPEAVQKPNWIWISGAVRPRAIPSDFVNFLHVYWLAFRACVLPQERPERLLARLVYDGEGQPADWSIDTEYELAPGQTDLVQRIRLFNPGVVYLLGSTNHLPLPPPYDRGYVTAAFVVHRWSDIGGWLFPAAFSWEVYRPQSAGASSNDLEVLSSCTGMVTSIESVPGEICVVPRPPEGAKMVVVDYRFDKAVGLKGSSYVTTKGYWGPDSPEFRAEVSRLRAVMSDETQQPAYVRKIIRLTIAALFVVLLGAIIFSRRKTRPAA